MTDGDLAAFDAAWDRFASWLSARCPIDHVALRSPATAEEIAALETRLGFPLHPQLRALLERHNGVIEKPEPDNFHAGAFLPLGHRLNDTEHIIRQHEWLVHERELIAVGQGEDNLYGHAHQWVPFAHPNDGGTAFVDHRPGRPTDTSTRWASARGPMPPSGRPAWPNCSTTWPRAWTPANPSEALGPIPTNCPPGTSASAGTAVPGRRSRACRTGRHPVGSTHLSGRLPPLGEGWAVGSVHSFPRRLPDHPASPHRISTFRLGRSTRAASS
ncbi:SMI1/KNR4 family protein [Streptomyces hirsutus]|uniref:SMI1/KNR4 family protein n=1 Tax=Streptomyces hirsutus TaxID=35620 RepID=UPI00332928A6